ncbi:MAG TPA: class I SAM-dependent rRNA methyltransferase, partial [Terriglobales bacterium]|nr:class I SAM-dependent rRNA methyltransferase [Terriglobales bacterium]
MGLPSAHPNQNLSSATRDVHVTWRAAVRLRSGHPWIYRSDVEQDPALPRGGIVRVLDERQRVLGWALASSSSQIALRIFSEDECSDSDIPEIVAARVQASIAYREQLGIPRQSNAYRLVFSEADQLPGLIVDRYNDILAFQVLTQAMDREEVRESILTTLEQELHPMGIVERVEGRIRDLEDLPPISGGLIRGEKLQTTIEMNATSDQPALRFGYDASAGQKTGAFLDQRENYAVAEQYAHGNAMDVFCYQGGFALHLARVCQQVTGVDASRTALEAADRNFDLNRSSLRVPEIEWIEGNAFDLLRDWSDAGRTFGTIVLDPPAFAKTKRAFPTAIRGYKELNLRALKMVEHNGIFISCSCSHHVSQEDFLLM